MRLRCSLRPGGPAACLAAFLLLLVGGASADEVRLLPVQDATLIESPAGALANGSGPAFFSGRTSQGPLSRRRALVAFDVASAVPPGSTITSAVLVLNLSSTSGGAQTIELHRLLSAWGEGASISSGGGGAPSTPGDATWIHTFYDSMLWASPGGDFDPSPRASSVVDQPGTYVWGPTPEMTADVQAWLDAPPSNLGWILIGNEASPTTVKRFDSRESPEAALRPILDVEYLPPCIPNEPRGPGYWQRQCLGVVEPTEPDFVARVAPCAEALLTRLGLGTPTACEGIEMSQPKDPCEHAFRRLTSLALNVCAGRIQSSCPVESADGCTASRVGDLLAETAALLRAGDCRAAARFASVVPGD